MNKLSSSLRHALTHTAWLALALGACGDSEAPTADAADSTADATTDVSTPDGTAGETDVSTPDGTAGETVTINFTPGSAATGSLEGLEVMVPAGASTAPLAITVSATSELPGDGWENVSPIYRFEPAGTTFDAPLTVRFAIPESATDAVVFWKGADDTSYREVASTAVDGALEAHVTHFSTGFVGRKKTGPNEPFTPLCGADETASITGALATAAPASGTIVRYRAIVHSCVSETGIVGHVYLRYMHLPDFNAPEDEEVLCGQRITFRTTGAAVDPTAWKECEDCPHAFAGIEFDPPTSFGSYCDAIQQGGDTLDNSIYTGAEFLVFGEDGSWENCAFVPHLSVQWHYWRNIAHPKNTGGGSQMTGGLSDDRKSCRYNTGAVLEKRYP